MLLIVDANVLIDYCKSDLSILALCSNHLGPIYVPSVVLDEVEQLDLQTCENLGLIHVEEPLAVLLTASEQSGGLSFQDHICLALAKENGWVCVTNEKLLRNTCQREGVKTLRGLRLMIELVTGGFLTAAQADEIAAAIQQSNPRHITDTILQRFRQEIGIGPRNN
jgi:predicted nucleic acid-binding protein